MWIEQVKEKAKKLRKKIIMPEGDDERVREAAYIANKEGLASVTLITSDAMEEVNTVSPEENTLYQAAGMVARGDFDGMVAGAVNTTADVVRTALKTVKVDRQTGLVSSFFLMETGMADMGESGAFLFADCAVVPDPDPEKLAGIAIATAVSARVILGWDPRVALLSFSTKGSSAHESVLKVREAVEKLREKKADFVFDGELQADTAIVPEVARKKDPGSLLGGRANILIFPDLNSGNIAYKITQRLGGARAVGPILQGFNRPVNDLSRGCSVNDIVDAVAFTALQTQRVN